MNEIITPPPITPMHLYERWIHEMETENTELGRVQAWKWFAIANEMDMEEAIFQVFSFGPQHASEMLSVYKTKMLEKNLAPWTINTRIKGIRALLNYAHQLGLIGWQPYCKLVRQGNRRDSRGPSQDEIRKIFDTLGTRDMPVWIRNMAIVRLMYNPALRRHEVLGLDIEHVEDGRVSIKGKSRGGREWVTLPDSTNNALQKWMAIRPKSEEPAVFISLSSGNLGDRISRNTVEEILRPFKVRCHGLRHSAITQALEVTNGDIRAVMKFSRHSTPGQVLAYDDCRQDFGGKIAKLIDEP